ncbi:MAG TPA: class II aldolase/adducin family protein [Sphingobacteriaceae bacterium]|nr:class II aldolase/adducin family protein [Sphingobacteriaceae bacterium]
MQFTFVGVDRQPALAWLADGLREHLTAQGYEHVPEPVPDIRLVFNFFDPEDPRPYRRRGQATFVVGVVAVPQVPEDVLRAGYPLLVRSLSNLLLYVSGSSGDPRFHFITLEQGAYPVEYRPEDKDAFFRTLIKRLAPLATSELVVNNVFVPDLPEELWEGDEITRQLTLAGQRLDALDLLPAPFPIEEILPPEDFRHVQRLYGLGGLSYGNLSARRDTDTFWMSASGVNKAKLEEIGRDILLVTGYDPENKAMILSVPPHVKPRRVSVDAIEHWMIYKEHPEVGAIVHVHAWMEGIPSTEVNYPCGTRQLAEAVAELVRQAPDPSQAVIGLRNHGLTVTGRSLDDIFDRLEGRIVRQVPMT